MVTFSRNVIVFVVSSAHIDMVAVLEITVMIPSCKTLEFCFTNKVISPNVPSNGLKC